MFLLRHHFGVAGSLDDQRDAVRVGVVVERGGGPPLILGLCRWKIPPIAAFRFPCGRAVIVVARARVARIRAVSVSDWSHPIILKFLACPLEFQKLRQQTDSQLLLVVGDEN